jgi:serine/threonine protein kinase
MTPERWHRIETLYHGALGLAREPREAYLARECEADDNLRQEVESLLRGETRFLSGQAIDVVGDLSGAKLGRYEITQRIGAGGMGVVYRARDTRLNRDVALKVLPADSVADPERKRRFVQEARAASALNHPNIVSVFDIDEADGVEFITMECLAGKTLAEMVKGKRLPFRNAVGYSIQIADALAAAHASGIVHRDLKPGNVMITAEGRVKVLDFGLAKLRAGENASDSTAAGVVAGTPAYMSPEQAEGKKVDARSDICSFGAVLYEMLSGRPAFARESVKRDSGGGLAR